MDALQEFLSSLSNEDRDLIKTIQLQDTKKIPELDHIQFRDLIFNSLSVEELGKLSEDQLQRRGELIAEIKRIRVRLIIQKYGISSNQKVADQDKEQIATGKAITTVSETIRRNSGSVKVHGMIVSVSAPFKMISKIKWQCTNFSCGKSIEMENNPPSSSFDAKAAIKCPGCSKDIFNPTPEYINAKAIRIQDNEPRGELERLDAMLYEKNTENVNAGEVVELRGNIYIQSQNNNNKNKKLFSILHSTSIKYEQREELILTQKDIEAFHKFAGFPDLIGRLVSMTAPNVIGEKDKKLGILRSAVGAREQENSRRGRINTLFVGPPGTAKSMLAREATKLIPNSRYITAQNASGKSLTAIIDKESDNNTFLRLGPIPLAKNAICAINEIGSMNFEDQRFLLDIMEEGRFTIDKYGIHQEIDSPTIIIATANPHGAYWKGSYKIGKEEIPVAYALIDRFDQIYGFKDSQSEEEIKQYAESKIEISKRQPHNYNFLKKYILYAKTNIHPKLTGESIDMLNRFWEKLKANNDGNAPLF